MAETMRTRELEFINSLRAKILDPEGRGSSETDTFTASPGQTVFILSETMVKYVSSVTVNGVPKYIGYHYTVVLGEGSDKTDVNFKEGLSGGDTVVINYHSGQTILYEGFQRLNSSLPRMSMILNTAVSEMISIGENGEMGGGKQKFWNVNYQIEVRSAYAKQLKNLLNNLSNVIDGLRQTTPQLYRTLKVSSDTIHNYDYDNMLRLYRGRVYFTIKWVVTFK